MGVWIWESGNSSSEFPKVTRMVELILRFFKDEEPGTERYDKSRIERDEYPAAEHYGQSRKKPIKKKIVATKCD